MKSSTVKQSKGRALGCIVARCVSGYRFWDGGVRYLVQTTADMLGSNERL